jgi:hypothetical protein
MKRQQLSIVVVAAAALTLGAGSAWSQDRGRPQNERPSGGGESTGSAVPRGGGGDSGSSSSSGGGSGSSAGSSTAGAGSAGSSSAGTPTPWMSAPVRDRAPVHPDRAEQSQRRGGGSSSETTGRAVPRAEAGGREAGSAGSASSSPSSERQPAEGRNRAVPTYSRPRDGRPAVGTAVERTSPIYGGSGNNYRRGYYYDPYYSYYYDPYYGRYSYWSPFGYGYGLGYFSYDPFLFSGYGYGAGYPSAYGYDPYGGGAGGGYGSRYNQTYRGVGSLRLKVKPTNAQVYVDGYYVGVIDSFDGTFQRLSVEGGSHRIELRAEGFEPVEFDVMVTPGDTITYKGELKAK